MKENKTTGSRTRLRDAILSGEYMPGTYLPSARELARKLDISKSLVHNILRLLQDEGLIQIRPGNGAQVLESGEKTAELRRFFVRPSDFGTFRYLPVASALLRAIAGGAERRNVEMLVSFSDSARLTDEMIAHYGNNTIQGVIYGQCRDYDQLIAPLEKAAVPYVVASDDNGLTQAVRLWIDYREVARNAVRYLKHFGHRKIGILTGSTRDFLYSEMLAGFRGALAEEELPLERNWILTNLHYEEEPGTRFEEVRNFLTGPERPSALFTVRDYRAHWVYQAAEELKLRIPEDLSVVSFDGHSWKGAAAQGLSVFLEPLREQGERSVELLRAWVTTGQRPASVRMDCPLMERASVAWIHGNN